MAELSKIRINNVDYDLKDAAARQNSGVGGYSTYYMNREVEYPVEGMKTFSISQSLLSNGGLGIKVGDMIISANGTLCEVTSVSSDLIGYKPIGNISGDGNTSDSGVNVDLTGVVKSVNGVTPDENGNVDITVSGTATAIDYEQNVKAINHRGYSASAPENTIPAYILSKQMGFTYAEADVSFTSDGVAVLLHDATIDRTSNGSGSISAMTYAEASKYDYGSWKNTKYTGTRIPTFEEFIILCKRIGLHPYIELKQNDAYTQAQIQALVEMVKNCGMDGKVTWISFAPSYLEYVKAAAPSARLGYLVSSVTSAVITTAQGLQTDTNEVFIDSSDYDADAISLCQAAGLPLEIWTINSSSVIQNMNAYITGVTSDNLIAGKILYDAGMVYEYGIDGETEKTLTSISATYSGGSVAVGTSVTALTGIVVTAHYSDGSTSTVTGYTLSGTIVEGTNTVTVSYGGKTTTFSVTGVAESGGGSETEETIWSSDVLTLDLSKLARGGSRSDLTDAVNNGYVNEATNRVIYAPFDIDVSTDYSYKIEFEAVTANQLGVIVWNAAAMEVIANKGLITQGEASKYCLDSNWQSNGYEFVPTVINNSPPAYIRPIFRKSNNADIDVSDITSITITRTKIV